MQVRDLAEDGISKINALAQYYEVQHQMGTIEPKKGGRNIGGNSDKAPPKPGDSK